jgi:hypothetical protein
MSRGDVTPIREPTERRFYVAESKVWHTAPNCRGLTRANRYWPVRAADAAETDRYRLRPCKWCANA